jgi:hypothetical protein
VTLMIALIQFGTVFKDWISVTDSARVAATRGCGGALRCPDELCRGKRRDRTRR